MRPLVLCLFVCTVFIACDPCASPMRPNHSQTSEEIFIKLPNFELSDCVQLFLLFGLVFGFCSITLPRCKVRYVPFHANLSTLKKIPEGKTDKSLLFFTLLCLLASDNSFHTNLAFLFHISI